MTDSFAELGQPRRPWLDAEQLKDQFHQLSSAVHPDRSHGLDDDARKKAVDRYAELNAAYQCRRLPKTRVAHLLLLERGTKPGDMRDIPQDVTGLFAEVGALLREAGATIAEKQQASSAIQKAGVLARALPLLERIGRTQATLQASLEAADGELLVLDEAWANPDRISAGRNQLLDALERHYHTRGFLERWTGQLQEKLVQLTL